MCTIYNVIMAHVYGVFFGQRVLFKSIVQKANTSEDFYKTCFLLKQFQSGDSTDTATDACAIECHVTQ